MSSELGPLDAETFKPLQYKIDGDEEWRELSEVQVLEAYREAKIPSSTLFRRSSDGVIRTLATLLSWNGRECPFADFTEPLSREGERKKRRSENTSDVSTDENQNCVDKRSGERGREGEGRTDEDGSGLLNRLVGYMDEIQNRIASVEKMHTEQQHRLAGAEIFMKKVAALEVRVDTCEKTIRMMDKRSNEMYEFVFFSKRAPLGQSGKPSTMQTAEVDEMIEAAKKMHAEFAEKSHDIDQYKDEVQKVHNMEVDLNQRLELINDRYNQLVSILSANERNEDVRAAVVEWNKKLEEKHEQTRVRQSQLQQQEKLPLGFGNSVQLVPLPRRSTAIASVSEAEMLDWRYVQERAASDRQLHQLQTSMRSQLTSSVGLRVQGLLLGREGPNMRNDREATPESKQRLHQLGTDSDGRIGGRLSVFMECPHFTCVCGANIQSGLAVIVHFNSGKHTKFRSKPVYQSDVDFFTEVMITLKSGQKPLPRI